MAPKVSQSERRKFERGLEQGTGQGGTGLFDTWGATEGLFGLGGKAKDMDEILNDPSTKYTPGKGYGLNWWQKNVSKITDQDVANARIMREKEALETKYGDQAELYGIPITGKTSRVDLAKGIRDAKQVEDLSNDLKRIPGGNAALAQLRTSGGLTPDSLIGAITTLEKKNKEEDPMRQLAIAQGRQAIATGEANIKRGEAADDLARSTLQFQRDSTKADQDWRRSESERAERRHQLQMQEGRIEREMIRAENADNRAADLKIRMAELESYNQNQQADREYKHKLMKQQKTQNLVEALVGLSASFAL